MRNFSLNFFKLSKDSEHDFSSDKEIRKEKFTINKTFNQDLSIRVMAHEEKEGNF